MTMISTKIWHPPEKKTYFTEYIRHRSSKLYFPQETFQKQNMLHHHMFSNKKNLQLHTVWENLWVLEPCLFATNLLRTCLCFFWRGLHKAGPEKKQLIGTWAGPVTLYLWTSLRRFFFYHTLRPVDLLGVWMDCWRNYSHSLIWKWTCVTIQPNIRSY